MNVHIKDPVPVKPVNAHIVNGVRVERQLPQEGNKITFGSLKVESGSHASMDLAGCFAKVVEVLDNARDSWNNKFHVVKARLLDEENNEVRGKAGLLTLSFLLKAAGPHADTENEQLDIACGHDVWVVTENTFQIP